MNEQVARVIKFLSQCGDPDIESGIVALLAIGSKERIERFITGLADAMAGKTDKAGGVGKVAEVTWTGGGASGPSTELKTMGYGGPGSGGSKDPQRK